MRRFLYITFGLVMLLTVVSGLLPIKAHAAPPALTGTFQDASTITVDYNGTTLTYFDPQFDSTFEYTLQGGDNSCSKITRDQGNLTSATIYIPTDVTLPSEFDAANTCASQKLTLANGAASQETFVWQDQSTLTTSDGHRVYDQDSSDQNNFTEIADDVGDGTGCQDGILVSDPSSTSATLTMRSEKLWSISSSGFLGLGGEHVDPGVATQDYPLNIGRLILNKGAVTHNGNCYDITANVKIAPFDSTGKTIHGANSGGTGSANHSDNVTCDTGGFGINWILCPVFNSVAGFSGWMFSAIVQPFLRTAPISTNPSDDTYKIWSSFRVYGDIFLVIALLVVVFGQSIGGGLIDAYTAKKVLPRLLAAAILINLSIYIVAGLVDITNIVGGGIGNIITAPLKDAGAFNISPSGIQGGKILGIGAAGLTAGLATGVIGLFIGIPALVNFIAFIGLFVLMPVFFGLLAAFLTLVVRKAIILALVLVSPVAFALYCLPNTEKWFRKWWDFLIQTLLVYPLVILFFAIADVLSVTIMDANGKNSAIAPIVAFVLQFLPLLFIPYAFRLAGGGVGKLHELLTDYHKRGQEAIKGNPNDPNSLRNKVRKNFNSARIQNRGNTVDRLNKQFLRLGQHPQLYPDGSPMLDRQGKPIYTTAPTINGRRRLGRSVLSTASRVVSYGNLEGARSDINKEEAERVSTQQGFGADSTIRKAFAIERDGRFWDYYDTNTEVARPTVMAARRNVMGNISAFQESLSYEMTKANNDGTYGKLQQRFAQISDERGWSEKDTNDIWIGAAFKNKGLRLEQKHRKLERGKDGVMRFTGVNLNAFSEEFSTKLRSPDVGNLQPSSFGTANDDIDVLTDKVTKGGKLTADELKRAQFYTHAYENLKFDTMGPGAPGTAAAAPGAAPPAAGAAPGAAPGGGPARLSFGGTGESAVLARQGLEKVEKLGKALPGVDLSLPAAHVGTHDPVSIDGEKRRII